MGLESKAKKEDISENTYGYPIHNPPQKHPLSQTSLQPLTA